MVVAPVSRRRHESEIGALPDIELVAFAREGDEGAIRMLIQRHNRRLFRTARAIVRDDAEAEDVVQAAYVLAFTRLGAFRGDSQLSTWLTRITLNEALGRMRANQHFGKIVLKPGAAT